ncbi:hypothetical protein D1604_09625 [Brevundimonas sp. LPMIX5]|nr:hypothetical protein D1604_09625 [Brevundimonas sp. LPMIX5]
MESPATENGLGSHVSCIQDFAGASAQFNVDFARYLSVSDDLFILGYPKGIIDETLQPLWKRATVATAPHLGWERQKKFLVDCASRDGMSGAPVITYSKSGKLQVGGTTYVGHGPATLLHGIYVNRIGGEAAFEAQIGTVWKSEVIDEIIDAAVQAPHSSAVEASNVEIRDLIRMEWPCDGEHDFADAVVNKGQPSGYFSFELSKTLNGRAAFEHVDALVMEEAVARSTASSK